MKIEKRKGETKKLYSINGVKFQKYIYMVEKELSVEDSKPIMDYNLKGYRFYVIHNRTNHLRFLYVTTKKLKIDTILNGKGLLFRKINTKLTNDETIIYLQIYKNNLNNEMINIVQNNKDNDCIPLLSFQLFYKEVYEPNSQTMKITKIHKNNLHDTRIVIDKDMWFIEELKNLGIKDLPKKMLKDLLNKAVIDNRLKKTLITELFIIEQYRDEEDRVSQEFMMNNSHSIVLTQGSTGKSSILCTIGNDLHTTTDAGMFGYMDVTASSWRAGEVSKTTDAIIIDEINEIIKKNVKKGESVLDILNTPLENGRYNYGKAGGMKIQFGNQFNFLGNISDEFHFENFVNGLSGNQSTMGRRFAYIIYDDKLTFKNGDYRDIVKHLHKIKPFKEYLSYILTYFLKQKRFQDKKVRINKKLQSTIGIYQKRYKTIIENMEHPNTKQFFTSFTNHSLENRVPTMALKLTIFKFCNQFAKVNQFGDMDLRLFWNNFYTEFENILQDNEQSLINIVSHQKTGTIIDETKNKSFYGLERLNKIQRLILLMIVKNVDKVKGIKLNYDDIRDKSLLRDLKNRVVNKNQTKSVDELKGFGVHFKIEKKNFYFIITNQFKFKEMTDTILSNKDKLMNGLKEREVLCKGWVGDIKPILDDNIKNKKNSSISSEVRIENAWNKGKVVKNDAFDDVDMSDLN